MKQSVIGVFLFGLIILSSSQASALILYSDSGDWPENWAEELEPLRKKSRTIGIATGIQENIYEIPFEDREAFEKIWPVILKLRTFGSPLILSKVSDSGIETSRLRKNIKTATVRIHAPSRGVFEREPIEAKVKENYEKRIQQGEALRVNAPWPKSIIGKKGELPKYVVSKKGEDGKLRWIAADFEADRAKGKFSGFYHRARIDIELVIDGKIIDLNRIRLPDGVQIIEQRFEKKK